MIILEEVLDNLLRKDTLTPAELDQAIQLSIAIGINRLADTSEELVSSLESVSDAISELEIDNGA